MKMTKRKPSSTSTTKELPTPKDGTDPTPTTWTTTTGGQPDIKVGDCVQVRNHMNPDKWFEDYFILRVEPSSFVVIRHFYSNCAGGELSSQHGAPMRITIDDIRPQEKAPRIMPPLYAWKPIDFCKYAESMIKGRTIYEYSSMKRY